MALQYSEYVFHNSCWRKDPHPIPEGPKVFIYLSVCVSKVKKKVSLSSRNKQYMYY